MSNLEQISSGNLPHLAIWLDEYGIHFDIDNANVNEMVELFYLLFNHEALLEYACQKLSSEDAQTLKETYKYFKDQKNKTVIEPISMSKRL